MTDFLTELFGGGASEADRVRMAAFWEAEAQESRESVEKARAAIAAYNNRRLGRVIDNPCPRCNGYGRIDAFQHFKGGSCFRCCGTGRA